jgi:molybdenum cofactor synthesis domain-containing protein
MARVAILTCSDKGASGDREDASGDTIQRRCLEEGHTVVARAIVPDDRDEIAAQLVGWSDSEGIDIVLTTGGTGLTRRDVTPEATRSVADREVPAIATALAIEGLKHTPYAALTRGIAVTRGNTLIVNLPGSPKAVEEGMGVLLPLLDHARDLLAGPVEHRN